MEYIKFDGRVYMVCGTNALDNNIKASPPGGACDYIGLRSEAYDDWIAETTSGIPTIAIPGLLPDFNAYRDFESIVEAVDYCNEQPNSLTAVKLIIDANIAKSEYGFASEMVLEAENMADKAPTVETAHGQIEGLLPDFDADRDFESIVEAVNYCNQQPNPITAVKLIIDANIAKSEYGFASEMVLEAESLKCPCPNHDQSGPSL